jgi:hypothetical protein
MITDASEKLKKNQPSYSIAHIVKRKKMLMGNVACLTNETVKIIIASCEKKIGTGLAPSYILASLFTGRSVTKLWEAKIALPPTESDGNNDIGFYIFSSWQHPKLVLPSIYLNQFQKVDGEGEIILPMELFPAFEKSRDENVAFEELKNEIDLFCQQNFTRLFQHINLTRIQHHFSHCAPQFEISRADIAFIADFKLEDHPHCSYGLFDTRSVIQKHLQYIRSLTIKAGLSGFEVRSVDKKSFFGSHRVLKESSVIAFFDYCVQQINRNPSTHAELILSFNFYTFYVVSFLELCTMHRPILSEFGKFENFDLVTGSIVITDKGEQSSRIVPMCKIACTIVSSYLKYLRDLVRDLRFTFPEISNAITKSLVSESSLFQLWDNRGIKPYHPNNVYTLIESVFPLPHNWPRHYIATMLMGEGVSRNEIEPYMGHAPAPDQIYNELSSFNFENNWALSDKIEKHITQELNLPLIY